MRRKARTHYLVNPSKAPVVQALHEIGYRLVDESDLSDVKIVGIDSLHETDTLAAPDNIPKMAAAMRRGAKFPPIVIEEEGGILKIKDGHHRLHASRLAGYVEIPVMVLN